MRYTSDVVTCNDLLCDQRARRSEEEDLAFGKPAVEVEPIAFPEVSIDLLYTGQERTHITTAAIKVFPNPVGSETRVFSNKAM